MESPSDNPTRREVLAASVRGAALLGFGGLLGYAVASRPFGNAADHAETRWQIDPYKCIACGRCATECVLDPSAVKCVHSFAMCGYCDLCTGFFVPDPTALETGAENQLCPTNAIVRKYVEDPYYEYTIDESACIACGRCVKGCNAFGNGSLYLQIHHDRCLNCNECAIETACPSEAIVRVPADQPYLLKSVEGHG